MTRFGRNTSDGVGGIRTRLVQLLFVIGLLALAAEIFGWR